MSTLYIRFPSKAAADSLLTDAPLDCQYALAADSGAIEREGNDALNRLGDAIGAAQKVVLLLAASDITLLQVQVPPMSAAKLKAALPNLVEEQLMSDPADCVLVAGPSIEGARTVAVANRAWLEKIIQLILGLGARSIVAVPLQLCLPYQPETVSAAVTEYGASLDIDLALRSGEQAGMGVSLLPEQPDGGAQDVVQTLCALAPQSAIALYVPQARLPIYQAAAKTIGQEERIAFFADNWPRWIDGARNVPFNLAASLGTAGRPGLHLQPWRWPLALAGLVLLVNIIGMNIEWLRLKREADGLRAGMTQTFRSAYPKEPLTSDPVLQMRRNISIAQQRAGQAAPEDFIALAAAFGEAWQNVTQGRAAPGIAGLDYAERSLTVRIKPEGEAPFKEMQAALAQQNLSITQQEANVWQIRSAK